MTTDEDNDSGADRAGGRLEELFSEEAETPESAESEDPDEDRARTDGQGATATSQSDGSMGPSMDPELDDAEILTDEPDGDLEDPAATTGEVKTASTTVEASGSAVSDSATDAEIMSGGPDTHTEGGSVAEAPSTETPPAESEPLPPSAKNRLTTGIEMLDRELEGGIPPGRMLSLVAPPETQSELLVKEMAISRPTVYVSTFRPEWEIREELHDHLQKSNDDRLLDNELRVSYVDPEDLLDAPREYIGDIPKGANLIIDSINEFEIEDRRRYVQFLNTVKEILWDTGSIGMFYGIEESSDPPARSLTLKRSDVVWQLEHSVSANEIQTTLIISKFRGGKALTEPVKLILTDDVQVDLSRDIA